MSRVAWLDCASGASGDMFLGALVDLGLPLDALRAELAKLPLGGYRLGARKVLRSGLQATKVDVEIERGHAKGHDHAHGHEHRGLREILGLLERSTLDPAVTARAAALFRRLGEAEAAVHGTPVEEVRFHEVGAVDSIVDVVGAVIGLRWLGADRIVASPLNVGTGTVTMAHGVFPVPPPATARLVTGVPVYGEGEGELLTPTGALLVTGHASGYGPLPRMRPQGAGHGAGSKDTPGRPNVLRILVGEEMETEVGTGAGAETVVVAETAIDDMSPQLFGPLVEKLLAAGALDAYCTAIQMKKGRPGVLVTVVAPPAAREALEDVLFAESTTLGLRWQEWRRTTLEREVVRVDTPFGPLGVKVARRKGRVTNVQPEFEDCVRAAEAHGRPVKEVWAAALAAGRARTT